MYLKSVDFGRVLKSTVKKEWADILEAMSRFRYFDEFDDVSKRECCILSKMKHFEKDATILGDNKGMVHYVHFILKGQAAVIEHLMLARSISDYGVIKYEMYERGEDDNDFRESQDEQKQTFEQRFDGEIVSIKFIIEIRVAACLQNSKNCLKFIHRINTVVRLWRKSNM